MRGEIPVHRQVAEMLKGGPRLIKLEQIYDGVAVHKVSVILKEIYLFASYRSRVNIKREASEVGTFDDFKEYVRRYLNYGPSR